MFLLGIQAYFPLDEISSVLLVLLYNVALDNAIRSLEPRAFYRSSKEIIMFMPVMV